MKLLANGAPTNTKKLIGILLDEQMNETHTLIENGPLHIVTPINENVDCINAARSNNGVCFITYNTLPPGSIYGDFIVGKFVGQTLRSKEGHYKVTCVTCNKKTVMSESELNGNPKCKHN